MTIQLDEAAWVRPRARREPALTGGLVGELERLTAEADAGRATTLADRVDGQVRFARVHAYRLGQRNAFRRAATLARRHASEARGWLLLAFVAGLLLGYAQHLYWVSLVTR